MWAKCAHGNPKWSHVCFGQKNMFDDSSGVNNELTLTNFKEPFGEFVYIGNLNIIG